MSKIVGVIHARMQSSRLPGKVLLDLKGKSIFHHHIERMQECKDLAAIYLATSSNKENEPLIEAAKKLNIPYYQGSEEDVLERLVAIADIEKADAVIRCGCDKPLFSFEIANQLLAEYVDEDYLSATNIKARGVGVELFSAKALKTIHKDYQGEFITNYIHEYPHIFKIKGVEVPSELSWTGFRLAVDTPEDFAMVKEVYEHLYKENKPIPLSEVLKFLDGHPEIANINRFVEESTGNSYAKQLEDKPVLSIYQNKKGQYVVKNRVGEIISYSDFQDAINNAQWENIEVEEA